MFLLFYRGSVFLRRLWIHGSPFFQDNIIRLDVPVHLCPLKGSRCHSICHRIDKFHLCVIIERELKKRQKDVETKKRTHRLCQIGGAVESVLGCAIEEEDIPKLVGFLKRQEANGKFFSKAMQKEPVTNTEEV